MTSPLAAGCNQFVLPPLGGRLSACNLCPVSLPCVCCPAGRASPRHQAREHHAGGRLRHQSGRLWAGHQRNQARCAASASHAPAAIAPCCWWCAASATATPLLRACRGQCLLGQAGAPAVLAPEASRPSLPAVGVWPAGRSQCRGWAHWTTCPQRWACPPAYQLCHARLAGICTACLLACALTDLIDEPSIKPPGPPLTRCRSAPAC